MNDADTERLDFLLRTKPQQKGGDGDEMFKISDSFTVEIIIRSSYFDILFWFDDRELDCWLYLIHSTGEIVCHDTKHRVGRSHFISDVMDKYPEIFEWVLWHPEIFEPPEVTSDE